MSNLQRIFSYTRAYWPRLLVSGACATLFGLFSAAPSYAIKYAIDYVMVEAHQGLLMWYMLLFVAIFVLKGLFMFLSGYYIDWVGSRVVNDIRVDLFSKIVYFPTSFYKEKPTGELLSHFLNDISQIQNASSLCVRNGIRSLFEAIFLLGVAFLQNFQLALLMVCVGPLILFVISKMGTIMRRSALLGQENMARVSSLLQEKFHGIRQIKACSTETKEIESVHRHLATYFATLMQNARMVSLAPACIEIITMGSMAGVFYLAVLQVIAGTITPGQLASFFAAILLAYQPVKRLVNIYSDMQTGLAASGRIFAVMDLEFKALTTRTKELANFQNAIVFDNLSFSYEPSTPILSNVNLTITRGSRIGFVGPSGCGKSTLCDLLLGFIVPTSGRILLDHEDITHVTLRSLRKRIGYVSQRPFLFNDTVHANISYGYEQATMDEMRQAAAGAYADIFINEFPNGYDSLVGEDGGLLSGGQKQRITIARALLRKPDILIFDEATSALDSNSEHMIKQALDDISKDTTVIIISHRPALLEGLDTIYRIEDGKVFKETTTLTRGLREQTANPHA